MPAVTGDCIALCWKFRN